MTEAGSGDLATFFAAITPFLTRDIDADEVAARLGESPSGSARMKVYDWLVGADASVILTGIFPSVANVVRRLEHTLWPELTDAYRAAHPATHWEIGRFGEHFAEFLRKRADPRLPPFLSELADFHYTKYQAADAHRPGDDAVMDVTVFVRQYTHAVPQFALAIEGGDRDTELPAPNPTIVLIYQAIESLRPRVFYPSIAGLLALASRTGSGDQMRARFPDVSDDQIAAAERKLVAAEVLAAPSSPAAPPDPG